MAPRARHHRAGGAGPLVPAHDTIERLRRLGVRFTIDDFGTGNSSLDRIGAFPVSTLKIDQSFVQVLGPERATKTIPVSAIVRWRPGWAGLRGRRRGDISAESGAAAAGLHRGAGLLLLPAAAGLGQSKR